MTWEVTVAGTLHVDDLTTPMGRSPRSHGGSAVFFALAAAQHARVHLHGIVGADEVDAFRSLLGPLPVDLDGLAVSRRPTFRWRARHDFERWIAVDTSCEPGCDPEWQPLLTAPGRGAPVMFLGSMNPRLQHQVLSQSAATLIGCDSMTDFTGTDGHEFLQVALGSDILFLNRAELASLLGAGVDRWMESARSLCGRGRLRAVVVKAGPEGAACVTSSGVTECPAHPVAAVVDPTGAGDALAGGFLGLCAGEERADDEVFVAALAEGTRCAAAAISTFGTAGLSGLSTTEFLAQEG